MKHLVRNAILRITLMTGEEGAPVREISAGIGQVSGVEGLGQYLRLDG